MKLTTLLAGIAAAGFMATGAQAADLMINPGPADPIYSSSMFNFEGFYVGGTAGVITGPTGSVGIVAGANFALNDAILLGAEFQGDALWNGGGFTGYDALLMGKLGFYLSDSAMIYGTGGGGLVNGTNAYALGGGLEIAMADAVSLRGEALALGTWGAPPSAAKGTVGIIFHLN